MLSVKQYAERVGLSYQTIWKQCSTGQIDCIRVGRSYRIDPEKAERSLRVPLCTSQPKIKTKYKACDLKVDYKTRLKGMLRCI